MIDYFSNQNELKFINAIKKIDIPNYNLSNIPFFEFYWDGGILKVKYSLTDESIEINLIGDVLINVKQAIKKLLEHNKYYMNVGGCYWIWTNEPIHHYLHNHQTPKKFNGGEIIYNGISNKRFIDRILYHIFGCDTQTWSAMGIDIYTHKEPNSHFKKACSQHGRVSMIKNINGEYVKINDLNTLYNLNLSKYETQFINKNKQNKTFYFRNGICLTDKKHQGFNYKIYFIIGKTETYRNYIESMWRNKYGLPRLCSYINR